MQIASLSGMQSITYIICKSTIDWEFWRRVVGQYHGPPRYNSGKSYRKPGLIGYGEDTGELYRKGLLVYPVSLTRLRFCNTYLRLSSLKIFSSDTRQIQ
jgi:hypothetical protein